MKGKRESEVAQSCPTLSNPMDYSLPGSSVHGIFQARVREGGAISSFRRSSRPRDGTASLACPALAGWFFTTSATFFNGQVRGFWQRRQRQPTPVLLPGESRGWRSLVGCSPWGCEELDMTERLHFPFSLSCIGEGNGNPLQCSCLENPRDGGAWWAAIYRVAQSRTQVK